METEKEKKKKKVCFSSPATREVNQTWGCLARSGSAVLYAEQKNKVGGIFTENPVHRNQVWKTFPESRPKISGT